MLHCAGPVGYDKDGDVPADAVKTATAKYTQL